MILMCIVFLNLHFGPSKTLELDFNYNPFFTLWNSPTKICDKHGIKLNLSYFDIIANSNDTFQGNVIVIFYKEKLGLYPWIDIDGTYINGGLPQLSNLADHIETLSEDIHKAIPSKNFSGVAVIDWEEWRPIFERNGYNECQKVYIRASESLIRKKHPDWPEQLIQQEARKEFQNASKQFIDSSLTKAKELQAGAFWGLYGFPDCYNDRPGQVHCDRKTRTLNDQLGWLFTGSRAFFPSLYLKEGFGTVKDRYWKVFGTLEETLRLKQAFGNQNISILPYTKYRYGDTQHFYDKSDLVNTIQQVAETGVNGVILWDSSDSFQSKSDCEELQYYLDTTLGPFVRNVTGMARSCSKNLCNSHGRCRKTIQSNAKKSFMDIMFGILNFLVSLINSMMTYGELSDFSTKNFSCICFEGWGGKYCQKKIS